MKYVSIDIETTGLDEEKHQIIEFAAIIEDSSKHLTFQEIPKFRRIVLNAEGMYNFSSYACNMNKRIIEIISIIENGGKYQPLDLFNLDDTFCYDYQLSEEFSNFLDAHQIRTENVNAAGKNFKGFDQKFLSKLMGFNRRIKFNYRGLDPGTIFIDWDNDSSVPNTEKCKQRAGFTKEVTHEALQDAWDVIQLLRADQTQKEEYKRLMKLLLR